MPGSHYMEFLDISSFGLTDWLTCNTKLPASLSPPSSYSLSLSPTVCHCRRLIFMLLLCLLLLLLLPLPGGHVCQNVSFYSVSAGEREPSTFAIIAIYHGTSARRSFLPGLPPRAAYVLLCVRVADAAADVADNDDDNNSRSNSSSGGNSAGDDVAAH